MNTVSIKNIHKELKYIDPHERRIINTNIKRPLSTEELIEILGPTFRDDVILYSYLDNYSRIEDLLPTDKSFKIILVRDSEYSGHYVVILRYSKTIEWFDSYGIYPGHILEYMGSSINKQLDQTKGELISLLKGAQEDGYDTIYNKKAFQEYSTDKKLIATCGYYCSLRIILLLKYNFDLVQFTRFLEKLKAKYKLNYDELVSLIIK